MMAYTAQEARVQLLDDLAAPTTGLRAGGRGGGVRRVDERAADTPEDRSSSRSSRPTAERAPIRSSPSAMGCPAHVRASFSGDPHRRSARLPGRAIEATEEADHLIAELQDSMMPVEVGDTELRAGLSDDALADRRAAGSRPPAGARARPVEPALPRVGKRMHPDTAATTGSVMEVPQPTEPATPVVPDSPVTPIDPDPGTPADPERPAMVPGPEEPAIPVVPEPRPDDPSPDPNRSPARAKRSLPRSPRRRDRDAAVAAGARRGRPPRARRRGSGWQAAARRRPEPPDPRCRRRSSSER